MTDAKIAPGPAAQKQGSTHRLGGANFKYKDKTLSEASQMWDEGGKGYLDSTEEKLRKYDTMGRKRFSVHEVKEIVKDLELEQRAKKGYKRAFGASVLLSVAFFGVLLAVVLGAIEVSKESHVEGGILLSGRSNSDNIVQTADAHVHMPLLAAPVLPDYIKLDSLTISYIDVSKGNLTSNPSSMMVKETFKIGSIRWVNDTFMTIDKSTVESPNGAAEVRIWNGRAVVLLKDGTMQAVCHGDAKCASIKVSGQREADALEEKALDALQSNSFITAEERAEFKHENRERKHRQLTETINSRAQGRRLMSGRRLIYDYGCCSSSLDWIINKKEDKANCAGSNPPNENRWDSFRFDREVSDCCREHDYCLEECNSRNAGCSCWGPCDAALSQCAFSSRCPWYDCECRFFRDMTAVSMALTPNSCNKAMPGLN